MTLWIGTMLSIPTLHSLWRPGILFDGASSHLGGSKSSPVSSSHKQARI